MRTSNYKKIKFTKSAAKKTGLAVGAILLAGIIFFFSFFHVTHVEVMENTHYSKKELKKMILTGAFSSNSILGTDHMLQSKSGECAVCGIVFRQPFRKKFHRDRCVRKKCGRLYSIS